MRASCTRRGTVLRYISGKSVRTLRGACCSLPAAICKGVASSGSGLGLLFCTDVTGAALIAECTVRKKLGRRATFSLDSMCVQGVRRYASISTLVGLGRRVTVRFALHITRTGGAPGGCCSPTVSHIVSCVCRKGGGALALGRLTSSIGLAPGCLSTLFRGRAKRALAIFVRGILVRGTGGLLRRSSCDLNRVDACLGFSSRDCFVSVFGGCANVAPKRCHGVCHRVD